jgi:hypothetical protein
LVLGKPKKFDYLINCDFTQNKVIVNKYKSGKVCTRILNKEFVEVGDVINVRNAMHTGGVIGATLSVNGTVVQSQTCECEINYTYVVQ